MVTPEDDFDYRYHADREFGLRCQKAGIRGVFDRELLAHHRYRRTPEEYLRDCRRGGRGKKELHRAFAASRTADETVAAGTRPRGPG